MKMKRPYRKVVYRQKVKILLVQIVNRNLGDAVIADNAAYLIRQALTRLYGKHYVIQPYNISSADFELVKTADLIVFAGGGLMKFKQEHFHEYVPDLLECAQQYDIPVYFNSIGVEGYDGADERCQRLARSLNYSCVKGISVRDDLQTLRRDYLQEGDRFVGATIDTAVFTPQVYGIQKKECSDCIGLGIVRWRIFEDYGLAHITREFQLAMWKGIAQELEARGYRWKLFVNGLKSDYDFAVEVLEYMGEASRAGQLLVQRPVESRELVEAIASFAGVVACRMHANIIAYSLGIPSVGLVWNDKMTFWGERIGCPQRFLDSGQFEPRRIVDCLVQSIAEGVKPCAGAWKKSLQAPLQKFLRQYTASAWKQKRRVYMPKPRSFSKNLLATALGGKNLLYANLNAPEGLEDAFNNGFMNLETDLRLTTDGKLVCVNGWTDASYARLGLDAGQYGKEGADYQTFMECRQYDGHYHTMDAAQLLHCMSQRAGEWRLVLDIGKPSKQVLAGMLAQLKALCGNDRYWEKHLLIRLQGKYDVETVQKAGLPLQIMYYIPAKEKREEKKLTPAVVAQYCVKQGIQWVSMPKEALEEEVIAALKKEGMKTCVFSYDSYTDLLYALALGVDWVGTSHLSPAQMDGWVESAYTIVFAGIKRKNS